MGTHILNILIHMHINKNKIFKKKERKVGWEPLLLRPGENIGVEDLEEGRKGKERDREKQRAMRFTEFTMTSTGRVRLGRWCGLHYHIPQDSGAGTCSWPRCWTPLGIRG